MNKYNDIEIGTLRKSRRLDDNTNAHMPNVCVRVYYSCYKINSYTNTMVLLFFLYMRVW